MQLPHYADRIARVFLLLVASFLSLIATGLLCTSILPVVSSCEFCVADLNHVRIEKKDLITKVASHQHCDMIFPPRSA